jgi:hypothetical protein
VSDEIFKNLKDLVDKLSVDFDRVKVLPEEKLVQMYTVTTLEFTVDVPKVNSLSAELMITVLQEKGVGNLEGVSAVFMTQLGVEKTLEFVALSREDQIDVIEDWIGGHYTWSEKKEEK